MQFAIERTLNSFFQSSWDFEIIAVNDGSSDDTLDIERNAETLPVVRVSSIQYGNEGKK